MTLGPTLVHVAASNYASVTFDELLAIEDASDIKHELVSGQTFAMAGGTGRHSMCIGTMFAALLPSVRAGHCRAFQGDMLLRTTDAAYYPDVMVSCVEPTDERYEIAPCFVAEVLSPSTQSVDRREKLSAYKAIPTVRVYLLVDHENEEVVVHERAGQRWAVRTLRAGDMLDLRCPKTVLDIGDLFVGLPD